MGRGPIRVKRQGPGEVVEGTREVVAVLPQQTAYRTQGGRQRLGEACHHCFGIAHVARIATRHRQIEIPLRKLCGRSRIACGGVHGTAQRSQFTRAGIAGPPGQAFQHLRVGKRFARRSMNRRRQRKQHHSQRKEPGS
jgi:hypothetical protein